LSNALLGNFVAENTDLRDWQLDRAVKFPFLTSFFNGLISAMLSLPVAGGESTCHVAGDYINDPKIVKLTRLLLFAAKGKIWNIYRLSCVIGFSDFKAIICQ
jgi:hypothetical protein